MHRPPDVEVRCEICGKSEMKPPYRAKYYRSCSVECRAKLSSKNLSKKVSINCAVCGKSFHVKPSHRHRRKCCSKICDSKRRKVLYVGENNPNYGNRGEKCVAWKGGRRISNYGYVLLHLPEHPNSRPDGYVLEHRFVMSEKLGRPLRDDEVVHHKDGNKQNNDISNLEIMSLSEHTRMHNKERELVRDSLGRIIDTVKKEDSA